MFCFRATLLSDSSIPKLRLPHWWTIKNEITYKQAKIFTYLKQRNSLGKIRNFNYCLFFVIWDSQLQLSGGSWRSLEALKAPTFLVDSLLLLCCFTGLCCWTQTALWTKPWTKLQLRIWTRILQKSDSGSRHTKKSTTHTKQSNASGAGKEHLLGTWRPRPSFTSDSKWVIISWPLLLSLLSDWAPCQWRTSSLLAQLCTGDLHSPRAAHADSAVGIWHLTVATGLCC